jgi:hypothetical protein
MTKRAKRVHVHLSFSLDEIQQILGRSGIEIYSKEKEDLSFYIKDPGNMKEHQLSPVFRRIIKEHIKRQPLDIPRLDILTYLQQMK